MTSLRRASSSTRRALMAAAALAIASGIPGIAPGSAGASPRQTVFTGGGFDECGLPSPAHLTAWLASPFRALNIYIGGVNEGCPQRVTKSWVTTVTKMGWRLIPTYVGLQAPHPECPCATIQPSKAYSEGVAAAANAVSDMEAAGIGPGNVVYDDMEGYTVGPANTPAVMTFLRGWTKELHAKGYVSGVYAGAATGVSDLVKRYGTSYPEPDDIWIADWNGLKTVTDPHVPATDWPNHQRLHQYGGGETLSYGGVKINIDPDYCDGAVVTASSL